MDGDELFRRGLAMLLSVEDDIEVVGEAGDGVAATELAATAAPDVVLMDVRLPRRSGIEACLAIKEVCPAAKIIMLTVSEVERDLYDAVGNGASGYLLKDSSIDEVVQAIRAVVAEGQSLISPSMAEGQSLISPSMAVRLLDEFEQMSRSGRQQVPSPRLTDRELEVLTLVGQGLNNREIAKRLFISENTVKNHMRSSLEKLQLHSRMGAVMYAVRENPVDVRQRTQPGWPIRVAVVEEDEGFRGRLTKVLSDEDDIEIVGEAGYAVTLQELAATMQPDVVVRDVHLPLRPRLDVSLMGNGASGYLLKDSSIDDLAQAIRVVASGRSMISPSLAIRLLVEFTPMPPRTREEVLEPWLADRELEVLKLAAQGLHNREIATRLDVSENTVSNHVRHILEKPQLHERTLLVSQMWPPPPDAGVLAKR